MRDTDKTLAAFVTVAVFTLITLVATIGVCNHKMNSVHEHAVAAPTAAIVDTDAVAIVD